MKDILHTRRVLLGVSGGIAAYKAADLTSKLVQAGVELDLVMTEAACRLINPLTFESLIHRPVHRDMFDHSRGVFIPHITLAQRNELIVIAPATANTIAKLAQGIADNLLSAICLAAPGPLLLAPAMETHMWQNPATRKNIELLEERGMLRAGPAEGRLASGGRGAGRMLEPREIMEHMRWALGRDGDLAGRKVVVTAGGTREALDPVRFISSHSSGKMGHALARAARDRGAQVTLITAVRASAPSIGVNLIPVDSAEEMLQAVLKSVPGCELLVMAAAVADFKPAEISSGKIKKAGGVTHLDLSRTPDILLEVAKVHRRTGFPHRVVGFAAETEDLLQNARRKLEEKGLDLIAANPVNEPDSGFGVETNRLTLLARDGSVTALPLLSKEEAAHRLLDEVLEMMSPAE